MKCVHCGANIPDDQMICPVCGAEVQIVPDYNPLDQETLTRREENKDFQLTLTDLYELEKVQDIKKKE